MMCKQNLKMNLIIALAVVVCLMIIIIPIVTSVSRRHPHPRPRPHPHPHPRPPLTLDLTLTPIPTLTRYGARAGHAEAVRRLLAHGARPEATEGAGYTALHAAAANGRHEAAALA